jgi:hypothetical protein
MCRGTGEMDQVVLHIHAGFRGNVFMNSRGMELWKNNRFLTLCKFTYLKTQYFKIHKHFNISQIGKVFGDPINNTHTGELMIFEKKCMRYCPFLKKSTWKFKMSADFFCNLFIFICAREQKPRPDYFTHTCKISKQYINKQQSYRT